MKKLVCGLFGTIYYATILKDETMGNDKVDVTKNAINAVAAHMKDMADSNKENVGQWTYRWKGIGSLVWITDKEREVKTSND